MPTSTINLSGYSTALFSTWFFLEDLGILFDAGDGVSAALLQKSRKVKQVFISHADRDHLGGLFQFHQLNARKGYPIIHYPANSGSFPAIDQFTKKFDPHVQGTIWKPILANEEYPIKGNIVVQSLRNNHIEAPADWTKSLSFKVVEKKSKLKEEFKHLSGAEIKKIAIEKSRELLTNMERTTLLGYSGDTPVDDYERWDQTELLIHEATFIKKETGLNTHAHKHSHLEEVLKMVSEIKVGTLLLSHFSTRYSQEQIDNAILQGCKEYKIQIPIYRLLPGETQFNILEGAPVNK